MKATRQLLGHASIKTTGNVYVDWDVDQLAASMLTAFAKDKEAWIWNRPRYTAQKPSIHRL